MGALQKAVSGSVDAFPPMSAETREDAEMIVSRTMKAIILESDAAMPRRSVSSRRKPANWLTDEIPLLRAKCLHLRRQVLRMRKRDTQQ